MSENNLSEWPITPESDVALLGASCEDGRLVTLGRVPVNASQAVAQAVMQLLCTLAKERSLKVVLPTEAKSDVLEFSVSSDWHTYRYRLSPMGPVLLHLLRFQESPPCTDETEPLSISLRVDRFLSSSPPSLLRISSLRDLLLPAVPKPSSKRPSPPSPASPPRHSSHLLESHIPPPLRPSANPTTSSSPAPSRYLLPPVGRSDLFPSELDDPSSPFGDGGSLVGPHHPLFALPPHPAAPFPARFDPFGPPSLPQSHFTDPDPDHLPPPSNFPPFL